MPYSITQVSGGIADTEISNGITEYFIDWDEVDEANWDYIEERLDLLYEVEGDLPASIVKRIYDNIENDNPTRFAAWRAENPVIERPVIDHAAVKADLLSAVTEARKAALGDSNDDEIELLQGALEEALNALTYAGVLTQEEIAATEADDEIGD